MAGSRLRSDGSAGPSGVQWHFDRLTSAGEQLKSGSASHLVVREDNCGMAVRRTEWAIIDCRMFPQLRGDTLYPANHVSIKLLGRSARSAKTIKT
jgi:hypothetical protein